MEVSYEYVINKYGDYLTLADKEKLAGFNKILYFCKQKV